MSKNKDINKITGAVNNILNAKTNLKRKKKNAASQNKQIFESIITELEQLVERENLLGMGFALDFSKHNDPFFNIIDKLILLKYGKEIAELVNFYLYERVNPMDGNIEPLMDDKGNEIVLKNIDDLWNLMLTINPSILK